MGCIRLVKKFVRSYGKTQVNFLANPIFIQGPKRQSGMNFEAHSPLVPLGLYLTWRAGCRNTHSDTSLVPCYSGRSHWKAESKWDISLFRFLITPAGHDTADLNPRFSNKGIFVLISQSASITGEKITTCPVEQSAGLFTTGLYCAKYSNYWP